MTYKKKLIEVALPLEDINREAAREKSIRHGHPSTLHLWWARRPLAACRAVLFASLVDDPSECVKELTRRCRQENGGGEGTQDAQESLGTTKSHVRQGKRRGHEDQSPIPARNRSWRKSSLRWSGSDCSTSSANW